MKAVYRVVSALLAALTIPALYFLNFIHYTIELQVTEGYLNDNITLQELCNLFSSGAKMPDFKAMGEHLAQTLQPLKVSAIVTAVFLVLMVLMILAVFFCSVFTNAKKVNLTFSLVGFAATIGAMTAFNHMTSLIINGTVPVSDILNALMADSSSLLAGIGAMLGAGSLSSVIGDLVLLRLSSAFTATVILFLFIVIWTVAFVLVDLSPDAGENAKVKRMNRKTK